MRVVVLLGLMMVNQAAAFATGMRETRNRPETDEHVLVPIHVLDEHMPDHMTADFHPINPAELEFRSEIDRLGEAPSDADEIIDEFKPYHLRIDGEGDAGSFHHDRQQIIDEFKPYD
jgi:hypothetical protein